jgi:hypothetical protein
MTRQLFGCAVAGLLGVATAAAAQNPPSRPQPAPDRTRPASSLPATVEGCLHREADVPTCKPNVAERAGIAEDYILTDSRIVKGTGPTANENAGSYTKAAMFDVQGLSADQLKSNLNKRVQIDGSIEHAERAQQAPRGDPSDDPLVELNGKTIRPVSGDCSGKR